MVLSPSSSAQAAREAVAKRLKELRLDAGISGHELAIRCEWSDSKSSRIENSKTPPSDADIRAWCAACNANDQTADLIAANRAADSMYLEWRRVHRSGMRRSQEEIIPLFERTRLCRIYCSNVAPGLIQTREYAHALMSSITAFQGTPNDVDEAVESRLARSRFLYEGDHRYAILIEETVLRYRVGDKGAMVGQLRAMLDVMGLPRVSFGVIPFTAERHIWPLEAFLVFDDKQVTTELLSAIVNITAPSEISVYDRAFRQLAGMAVYGAAARELINQAIAALE
ncbi:XRE family transcriptional regulator [Streptomyces sp. CB01881]|nr:helix-turn-helix transcriptional regulator [Streptomyces sp. CB01881]AUY51406.1 transcriptional regulator [Streptomyces sp. CB01881]TYC74796.1 XRE family transcriptional regulator [Streptomyces sp. CB01881]